MKEMFFELFLKPLKDKNYSQLFDIIFWAFVIIAPSFSYIFLYRRELFNEMDIIKLMILCLTLT